jgi:DNA-binding NarL/FixJ family response regulator
MQEAAPSPATRKASLIRVLICDDAAAFSLLVSEWIAEWPDMEVVGTASSGPELLEMLGTAVPDVIVLDHLLGAMDSEELTPLIRARQPGVGIVLISGMPSDALAAIATRTGVDTFSSKASTPGDIRDAVRHAAQRWGRMPDDPPLAAGRQP